jgi:hypothetical protein
LVLLQLDINLGIMKMSVEAVDQNDNGFPCWKQIRVFSMFGEAKTKKGYLLVRKLEKS